MNHYETVFILTPVLSDAQMKEAVEKFKGFLVDNGVEMVNEEMWGLKKLAYPIQKKSTGFYCLFEFKGEPTIVKKLETAYRRDERVLRFLTFRLDKYAAEYAAILVPEEDLDDEPMVKIEKVKHFEVKPMDAEEAVMEMELVGHSFFVFRNGETDEVNVVYKRKNGTYGLIEPEY